MNTLDQAVSLYSSGQHQEALKLALSDIGPLMNILAGSAQALGLNEDAEKYWQLVLRLQPGNHHAYNNTGLLLAQKNQFADAEACYRQALAICPDYAEGYGNLGLLLSDLNRIAEAEAAYRQALALKPEYAEALNNLGELLHVTQRPQEAEDSFRRALAVNPGYAQAFYNLGNLLFDQQRVGEAETAYRQTLAFHPGYADAYNNLGVLLKSTNRPAEAESAFRQVIALSPNFPGAYNNLGEVLRETGRFGEAESVYRHALALLPDYAEAWNNLGVLLVATKRLAEAEEAYLRALAAKPDYVLAYNNLGALYESLKRYEEAEAAYRQTLVLKPDFSVAHSNLGVLFSVQKRFDEAEAAFRRALALNPGLTKARSNLALILLSQGRFSEGWLLNEARYQPGYMENKPLPPTPPFAQWQGEPLAGKTLLVWHEQGFGDEIQFCRFIPELRALGAAKIDLACKPPLKPLLDTLAGVDAVYPVHGKQVFDLYDYWTFPLSIPLHLGLDMKAIPARLPYLAALPERLAYWQSRLPDSRPRVGLVWKGYEAYTNDAFRSLPGLSTLASLWTVPGITFVSLQKGEGEAEALNPPAGLGLCPLGHELKDFADTAAIVEQLDLVITVDTALGHVAGALAKPCWILLPYVKTDWRWLQEREDSPWYPGIVRLFRQGKDETWEDVAARVAVALGEWKARRT